MSERIQKALAGAGVASRREIERMIEEGRIEVNGRPAEPGQKVSADDKIRIDGRPFAFSRQTEPTRVLLYKKRVGELVTRDDPDGRRTVFRKLPVLLNGRWIAVGRLDINTSGLLLLTNDGELARRLMHPSFEITRAYSVRIHGVIDHDLVRRLKSGVELDDGPARFDAMVPGVNEDGEASNQWFRVTVRQGRNRLVRRLIESQPGLQVSRLIRVAYGPVELGRGIKSGSWREAEPDELDALLKAVGMQPAEPVRSKRARSARGEAAGGRGKVASAPRTQRVSRTAARNATDVSGARAAGRTVAKPASGKAPKKPMPSGTASRRGRGKPSGRS
ncbi:MAG: pseudouridine synthase [Nevskiales bacterium]|nr:pseudouridine synthase [Nevskiales bacterium]